MNKLINETVELLQKADFDWAFCGGWAIDLFYGEQTRKHSDIDVCVFSENRNDVIKLVKRPSWTLYDYCGGGIVHLNAGHQEEKYAGKSLCCVKNGNRFSHFIPLGGDTFRQEYQQTDQTELDYIDFVFNKRTDDRFLCTWSDGIPTTERVLDKAILHYQDVPYIAPEIALFFDSREHDRDDSEHDFVIATARMNADQQTWLLNSLHLRYPKGHPWINRLNNS
jgi:hypothetical protein